MSNFKALLSKKYILICLILFASITSFFSFGVSVSSMRIYIHGPLALINSDIEANFFNSFFTSQISLQYYLLKFLQPIYENKYYYSILTIIYKFLCILVLFEILKNFFEEKLSILFSILFFLAPTYYSHGMIVNGVWSAHMFINASASFIFSLIAFLYLIKEKFFISVILCIVSINFHALYGINFTIYYLIYLVTSKYKDKKTYLYIILILISIIIPLKISNFELLNESSISISNWMNKTFYFNINDFSYLHNLINYNFSLIFLSTIFITDFFNEKKINPLNSFLFISILFNFFIIIIEILHSINISFGVISELFIQLQLRRGVWIIYLFLYIYLAKKFFVLENQNFLENFLNAIFLFSIICFPNFLIFFIFTLFLKFKNKISLTKFGILNLTIFILLLVCRDIYQQQLFWPYVYLILIFIFLYFSITQFFKNKHYQSFIDILLLLTISSILLFLVFGIYQKKLDRFINLGSIDHVRTPNYNFNLNDGKISIDDFYNYNFYNLKNCLQNFHFIDANLNAVDIQNKNPILFRSFKSLNYTDSFFFEYPFYLEKSDIFRGATNRALYENLINKIDNLFEEKGFGDNFFDYKQTQETAVIQFHRIFYYAIKKDIMLEKLIALDKALISNIENKDNYFYRLSNKINYLILDEKLSEKFNRNLVCKSDNIYIYNTKKL